MEKMFEEDGCGDTETQAGVQPRVLENGVSSDSERPNKLLGFAYQSYKSGLYNDVTVVVGKQKFPAHRLVLASLSDYFPPLFKLDERDSEVALHGIEPDDFSVLLKYAYTGEVDVTKENVQSLLIAADYLSVNHVKHICERFMADNLDCDNVCDVLVFAMNYSLLWLHASSVHFLKKNLDLVSKTDGFLNLDKKFLTDFFEDDNLVLYNNKSILKSVEREKLILTAVLRYLSGRPRVDPEIEVLIRSVRLCEMPNDLVKKCLKDFKDLKKNEVVVKYVKMREVAANYLHERQRDLSFTSNASREIKSIPDSWFRHRKLTSSVIWDSGMRYAAKGELASCPNLPGYTYNDPNLQLQRIKIWLRTWRGRIVVGGIALKYMFPCSLNGQELGYKRGHCPGPPDHEIDLKPEELITTVFIGHGYLIDRLGFVTNAGRVLGPYGGPGGMKRTEVPPQGPLCFLFDINCDTVNTEGAEAIFNLVCRWITFE